jgi:hypothetical protein
LVRFDPLFFLKDLRLLSIINNKSCTAGFKIVA